MKNHSKLLSPRDSQIRIVQSNSAAYAASGFSNVYSSAKSKFKLAMESVSQACSSAMRFILPLAESNCQINDSPQVSTRLQPISDFILMKSDKPVQLDQGTSAPTPGRFEIFEDSDRKKEAFFNSSKFRDPHQFNLGYLRKPASVSKKEDSYKIVPRENSESERKDGIIEKSSRNSLNSGGFDTRSDRKNSDLASESVQNQTNNFRKEANPEKFDKQPLNSSKEEKNQNGDKKISSNATIPNLQPSKPHSEEQKLSEAKHKDVKVTLFRKSEINNLETKLESNSKKVIPKFSIETKQESPIKPKQNASQAKKPSNETPHEEKQKENSISNTNSSDQSQSLKPNPFASFPSVASTSNPFADKKQVSEPTPSAEEKTKALISEPKPSDKNDPAKPPESLTQTKEQPQFDEKSSPDANIQAIKPINPDDNKIKTFLNQTISEPNAGLEKPEIRQSINEVQLANPINPSKPPEETKTETSSNQVSASSNPFIQSSSQEIGKPRYVFGSGSISSSTQPAPGLSQTANPFAPSAPSVPSQFSNSSITSNPFAQTSHASNPEQPINPGQVNPFAVQGPNAITTNPFSQPAIIANPSIPLPGTQTNPFSASSNSFNSISMPFSQPAPSSSSTATYPYSAGTVNTLPSTSSNPFAIGPQGQSSSQGNPFNQTSSISSSGHLANIPYMAGTSSLGNTSQTNFDSTRATPNPFSQPVQASNNPFASSGHTGGYAGSAGSAGFGSNPGASYSAGYANNSNPFNRDVQMNGGVASNSFTNQYQGSNSLSQGFGNSGNGFAGSANSGNPGINPRPELYQSSYAGNKEFSIGIMNNRNAGRGPRTFK